MVDPVMRFVCRQQAHDYFEKLGLDLIHPSDANWGEDEPNIF